MPADHDWLQAHSGDVERVAAYLAENEIACALAHPFYSVDAPLTPEHRRSLARMFPVWETRNGSRERDLNQAGGFYIETNGGGGVGGSDDHAGVDIGRTFTRDAGGGLSAGVSASCPRRPRHRPCGDQGAPPSGSTPRWRSPPGRSAITSARVARPTRDASWSSSIA